MGGCAMSSAKGAHTMARVSVLLTAAVVFALARAAAAATDAGPTAEVPNLRALVDSIRDNRKALVAVNLNLTADEAAKFWPLYDRYQKEVNAIGDRMLALIEDYEAHFHDLSNDKAMQLLQDYLGAEAERLKVRRTYVDEFAKILPGRTVARFYQIENK